MVTSQSPGDEVGQLVEDSKRLQAVHQTCVGGSGKGGGECRKLAICGGLPTDGVLTPPPAKDQRNVEGCRSQCCVCVGGVNL